MFSFDELIKLIRQSHSRYRNVRIPVCTQCNDIFIRRAGYRGRYFWGCRDISHSATLPDERGLPWIPSVENVICPSCHTGTLLPWNGYAEVDWRCSEYPNCKYHCEDKNHKPNISRKETPSA
ncbi:MAG: hypothetical protein AB7F87_19930 [Oligoflexales bacterium]